MQEPESDPEGALFPRTATSMYDQISSRNPDVSRAGQERFYSEYTPLMERFLNYLGCHAQEAPDVVADFIAKQLHGKGTLKDWDPKRGKLRNFLRVRLKNHWFDQIDHDQAQKRGGHLEKLSIDHPDYQEVPGPEGDPVERHFDKLWADQIFDEAAARAKTRYLDKSKVREFELLLANLAGRSGNGPRMPQWKIAAELGCSENTVSAKMTTFRAVFISQFNSVVAETVAPTLVKDEQLYVRGSLKRRRAKPKKGQK